MTNDGAQEGPLAADEVLVYVGADDADADAEDGNPYEEQARIGGRRRIKERGLEVVKIDDEELDRLRSQVSRIARRLEAPDGTGHDKSFGVDSITLHVGLSASGHFFLVASAGVEAAIDITWQMRK
jgi:hypothetical protein